MPFSPSTLSLSKDFYSIFPPYFKHFLINLYFYLSKLGHFEAILGIFLAKFQFFCHFVLFLLSTIISFSSRITEKLETISKFQTHCDLPTSLRCQLTNFILMSFSKKRRRSFSLRPLFVFIGESKVVERIESRENGRRDDFWIKKAGGAKKLRAQKMQKIGSFFYIFSVFYYLFSILSPVLSTFLPFLHK